MFIVCSLIQDKEDDAVIGVKSTALKFGDQTKYWLTGFSSCMVTGLAAVGLLSAQTWPYYIGLGFVAGHLTRQVSKHTLPLSSVSIIPPSIFFGRLL